VFSLTASIARTWAWIVLVSGAAILTAPHYFIAGVILEAIVIVAAAIDLSQK
jgi:hypothetical protein